MEVKLPSETEVPLHEPLAWRTQIFEPLDFLVLQGPPVVVGELPGKIRKTVNSQKSNLDRRKFLKARRS